MKNLLLLFSLLLAACTTTPTTAATFNLFSPATGILKGNSSTYVTTAATSADLASLWTGTCTAAAFLRGDGACSNLLVGPYTSPLFSLEENTGASTGLWNFGIDTNANFYINQSVGTGHFTIRPSTYFAIDDGGGSVENVKTDGSGHLIVSSINSSGDGFNGEVSIDSPSLSANNALVLKASAINASQSFFSFDGTNTFLGTTNNGLFEFFSSNNATFKFHSNGIGADTLTINGSNGGVTIGAPTGGSQGLGTINATGLYVNGVAVGGGGTPGGSNTQVQFNNSGAFGGSSGFTWNSGTSTLDATNITGNNISQNGNQVLDTGQSAQTIFFTSNSNGQGLAIVNGSTGTSATNEIAVSNSSHTLRSALTSTGYTGSSLVTGGPTGEAAYLYETGNVPISFGTNGVESARIYGAGGMTVGAPTGGNQGAGTINATGLYVNGVAVGGGGSPAGSNTQIQFNNSGAFGASADFTWSSNTLTLSSSANSTLISGSAATTSSNGRTLTVKGGPGGSSSGSGGSVSILGGTPVAGDGGGVTIAGAAGVGTNQNGGGASLSGGNSTGTSPAGNAALSGGSAAGSGSGGNVNIAAGTSGSGTAGVVTVSTGGSTRLSVNANGSWSVNGATGSSTQVLTSNGSGSSPTWQSGATVTTGSFTGTLTGMSGATTGTVSYTVVGGIVTLYLSSAINGTSNTTSMTMTGLPAAVQVGFAGGRAMYTTTNDVLPGAFVTNSIVIGSTITFAPCSSTTSCIAAGYTASGTKGLPADWTITYPL